MYNNHNNKNKELKKYNNNHNNKNKEFKKQTFSSSVQTHTCMHIFQKKNIFIY